MCILHVKTLQVPKKTKPRITPIYEQNEINWQTKWKHPVMMISVWWTSVNHFQFSTFILTSYLAPNHYAIKWQIEREHSSCILCNFLLCYLDTIAEPLFMMQYENVVVLACGRCLVVPCWHAYHLTVASQDARKMAVSDECCLLLDVQMWSVCACLFIFWRTDKK